MDKNSLTIKKTAALAAALAEFLAKSFTPIRVSATLKQWQELSYKNDIFLVSTFAIRPKDYEYYTPERLATLQNISFSAPFFNHFVGESHQREQFVTAVPFLSSIIGGTEFFSDKDLHLDVYDVNLKETDLVVFDSRGKVPERWIRMIADFAFEKPLHMDHNSEVSTQSVEKYWKHQVTGLPTDTLNSLLLLAARMTERQSMSVKVCLAPKYTVEQYEGKELEYQSPKWQPDELQSLKQQVWRTSSSANVSPCTRIFFQQCRKYASFYPPNILPSDCEEKCGKVLPTVLSGLAAAEGGIDLRYLPQLPWFKLRPLVFGNFFSSHHEVRGDSSYSSYKDTPIEELVVLSEALKHQGALTVIRN